MRATALALAILLILPLLGAAVSPVIHADSVQAATLTSSAQRAHTQPAVAPLKSHLTGPQPFITLLCKFADRNVEPMTPAYFEDLLGATRPGLADYWREVSYGQISLAGSRVVGWYTLPRPAAAYRNEKRSAANLDLLADDCITSADADVDFVDFTGINLVFNWDLDEAVWGGKRCQVLDGQSRCYSMTWLWPPASTEPAKVAHEIGHTFGLQHSSAGIGEIYGNLWDAMSATPSRDADQTAGSFAPHVIAYNKEMLGWIPADRKLVAAAQGTATVELAALANPTAQGYLLAQIPIAGAPERFYTVEARLRAGYDRALPADAVLIHEIDPTRDPPARLVNHLGDGDTRGAAGMWQPGDVFIDAVGDVAVAVEGATATGFVVTITTGARPWPLNPAGSTTLPAGATTFTWHPVAGASGYELRVELQPPLTEASLFTRRVTAAQATIPLLPGAYRWQVRALPAGEWTPPVRVVTGVAEPRWLPSEIVSAVAGKSRSGLAIAVDPNRGVSLAWAATEGTPTQAAVRMARRGAAGWRLAEQAIPDSNFLTGTLSVVAVSAAGEVCGAWVNQPPRSGQTPADTGSMTNNGLWFACWKLPQMSAATDAGAGTGEPERGWRPESPVRINDEASGVRQSTPVLILDRGGNAFAAWNGARDGVPGIFSATRPVGQTWEPTARIADGADPWALWSPAVALDDVGNLHAIWADTREGASGIYAAVQTADSGWGSSARLSDLGTGNRINPTIAVDGQGNAYAAWQRFYDGAGGAVTGDIEFARQAAGAGWERPVRLCADIGSSHASPPVIAVCRDGAAYLVWEEEIANRYVLFSSFRPADGDWQPKTPIPDAAGNQAPAGPALAVDAAGNAYVTWIDTRSGERGIRLSQAVK